MRTDLPPCYRCHKQPCKCKDGVALYHGDCLDVMLAIEPESVDLVLTDPPYGISQIGVSHTRRPGKGSRNFDFFNNDTPQEAVSLMLKAAGLCNRLVTEKASAYWWVGHYGFGPLISWYEGQSWKTRFLVWNKAAPCPPPPGSGWPSAAELCVYAWRLGRTWTHDGKNYPQSNVITADSYRHGMPGKVNHPTQKPLTVIRPLIQASSCKGHTILDPFAGSGTTGLACKELGRKAILIEIEEKYCEIAARRLEQGMLFG